MTTQREILALMPQSKDAAETITEIWRKLDRPDTHSGRVSISATLGKLADLGLVKRVSVQGPKGRPMWKYWLDPMHG